MSSKPQFKAAFPYQKDVMTLPVTDIEEASSWYSNHFGMNEVERKEAPTSSVILERDGTKIGFAVNGKDPAQDGAAILVSNIEALKKEFESRGIKTGNSRIDERDGKQLKVFFVVAPDGLCFYFHEQL